MFAFLLFLDSITIRIPSLLYPCVWNAASQVLRLKVSLLAPSRESADDLRVEGDLCWSILYCCVRTSVREGFRWMLWIVTFLSYIPSPVYWPDGNIECLPTVGTPRFLFIGSLRYFSLEADPAFSFSLVKDGVRSIGSLISTVSQKR